MSSEVKSLARVEDSCVLGLLICLKIREVINCGPSVITARARKRENLQIRSCRRVASQTLSANARQAIVGPSEVHCILNLMPVCPHRCLSFNRLCQPIVERSLHLNSRFECCLTCRDVIFKRRSLERGSKSVELRPHQRIVLYILGELLRLLLHRGPVRYECR